MNLDEFFEFARTPTISESGLSEFERRVERGLPGDYLDLLRKTAGARCRKHSCRAYRRDGTCSEFEVVGFYSLDDSPNSRTHIGAFLRDAVFKHAGEEIRRGYLPVACGIGPEQLWMRLGFHDEEDPLGHPKPGTLFMDWPETEEHGRYENLVAPSLAAYFAACRVVTDATPHFDDLASAVWEEQSEASIEALLDAGYSLNQIFKNGNTLADLAAFTRNYPLLHALVERGACAPRLLYYATATTAARRKAFDQEELLAVLSKLGRLPRPS